MTTDGKRAVMALATWFGCGLAPRAPGTVGSLGAVPLHLLLRHVNPVAHTAVVLGLTAAGVWCAGEVARELGEEDPQRVVIDEVAGVLIALGFVRRRSAGTQVVALALFRALDILKPGPIARAEKAKPPGLGIMLDDIVAGLIAGIAARAIR